MVGAPSMAAPASPIVSGLRVTSEMISSRPDPQRSVFITGASSGIGFATAHQLLDRGWRVFSAARRLDAMEALRSRGAEVLPLNEAERIAQRTSQEIQYLAIENTRRQAKGMDALASLDDLVDGDDDSSDMPQDNAEEPSAASEDNEADEVDALITETARILADAINLSGPVMARADSR